MSRMLTFSLRAFVVGFGLTIVSYTCVAAGDFMGVSSAEEPAEKHEQSWYREQSTKPDSQAIVIQKAQIRAQQRNDRMASMQWYGQSNARPQAAITPFTSRYSPLWEMPGGTPYSWVPQSRPGYVMYWR